MELLGLFGINPASWVTSFVTAMFKDVLGAIGTAAANVLGALLGFMNSTTEPVFSGGWWTGTGENVFVRVLAVAGSLMFIGFAMSVVSSVLSRDHTIMTRAALHLPLAAIEMAALVTVTAALVSGSDGIANYIAGGGSKGLTAFVTTTLAVAVASGGIVGILLASFIIVAGLMVWAVLIVRTALVYVAVMAGPLIFAASIHPSTRHVRKRYVEGGIAIIGSKIVMAIAFATGSAMLGGITSPMSFGDAVGALMQALAILLIATFSPFIFIKLLIGAEALAVAEGVERRPLRAGMSAASGVYHGAGLKNMLGHMGGGSGAAGSADPDGGDSPPSGGSGPGSGGASTPGGSGIARAIAKSRRAPSHGRDAVSSPSTSRATGQASDKVHGATTSAGPSTTSTGVTSSDTSQPSASSPPPRTGHGVQSPPGHGAPSRAPGSGTPTGRQRHQNEGVASPTSTAASSTPASSPETLVARASESGAASVGGGADSGVARGDGVAGAGAIATRSGTRSPRTDQPPAQSTPASPAPPRAASIATDRPEATTRDRHAPITPRSDAEPHPAQVPVPVPNEEGARP